MDKKVHTQMYNIERRIYLNKKHTLEIQLASHSGPRVPFLLAHSS